MIFWAFVFPLVLTLALAAAFPSAADRPVVVGLVPGTHTDSARTALAAAGQAIRVVDLAPANERQALRDGAVHIVVVANDPPTYRYDPAQGESHRARLVVDDALKRAGGRVDPWSAA